MSVHRWKDLKHKASAEERENVRQRARSELLELDLRGIRELVGVTQQELAARVEQTQGHVSETERRSDHRLSTLRKYVEALGGELEVVAHFGDKRIRLHT